ncbi:SDR family oxidoreductase [Desulfovibrio litoralis]|uniref:3-hydroxy acid dehydrogenase / malonic semialdehyde reductase n=1 Tax=Desulfovibrio litoralis DSM 11393 TaxID=1121455 RepID=A0A1M7SLT2_9BACT|nr:SDR family oxidoreductase [Desulfovibrio litoralis]SHN59421.1 3-hydroxy acid dehydrogenase / malonic semialdehyde reductase [Desulfovibrio litoralis DSM 11393]
MNQPNKKVICITGASSGFGTATAKKFIQNGWNCIITGRRQERLESLAKELGEENTLTLAFDVTDNKAVEKNLSNLPEKFSKISVLVNNAGLALGLEPAQRCDLQDWETMIDTNIKGLLYCTRLLLPKMIKQEEGHIINLGSVAATNPYFGGNTYGATKAFVRQFSRNLRTDLHGTGLRVTNIEPGLAESEFSIVRFKGDKEKADNLYKGAHPITPNDIADMIYWVATTPKHININNIEVMPTSQSWSPLQVYKS